MIRRDDRIVGPAKAGFEDKIGGSREDIPLHLDMRNNDNRVNHDHELGPC